MDVNQILYMFPSTAIARVHRQISEESTPQLSGETTPGLTTQLQVSTTQVSNLFLRF